MGWGGSQEGKGEKRSVCPAELLERRSLGVGECRVLGFLGGRGREEVSVQHVYLGAPLGRCPQEGGTNVGWAEGEHEL